MIKLIDLYRAVYVKFQQGGSAECEARRADARGLKGRERERGSWGGGSEGEGQREMSTLESCCLRPY